MSLYIVKADITYREVDAIVCTANTRLHLGGNMGNKILAAAGKDILNELNQIGHCDVGHSVITKGYGLKAKYVIHTVGPRYVDGKHGEAKLLEQAYRSALNLAVDQGLETIELPLISSGSFRYPTREAAKIAIKTINKFLKENELNIGLVIYSVKTFNECEDLFSPYRCYVDSGFVFNGAIEPRARAKAESYDLQLIVNKREECPIKLLKKKPLLSASGGRFVPLEKSFQEKLFKYLNESGKTNAQVYKKGNIDRRLFSKIISTPNYTPLKITIVGLIIGMELDLDSALDLLAAAGYLLSDSLTFDCIVREYIRKQNYNIIEINETLFENHQPLI